MRNGRRTVWRQEYHEGVTSKPHYLIWPRRRGRHGEKLKLTVVVVDGISPRLPRGSAQVCRRLSGGTAPKGHGQDDQEDVGYGLRRRLNVERRPGRCRRRRAALLCSAPRHAIATSRTASCVSRSGQQSSAADGPLRTTPAGSLRSMPTHPGHDYIHIRRVPVWTLLHHSCHRCVQVVQATVVCVASEGHCAIGAPSS